jgi:hypothetical protein
LLSDNEIVSFYFSRFMVTFASKVSIDWIVLADFSTVAAWIRLAAFAAGQAR